MASQYPMSVAGEKSITVKGTEVARMKAYEAFSIDQMIAELTSRGIDRMRLLSKFDEVKALLMDDRRKAREANV